MFGRPADLTMGLFGAVLNVAIVIIGIPIAWQHVAVLNALGYSVLAFTSYRRPRRRSKGAHLQ